MRLADVKAWVQEQVKKGYTVQQLRQILKSKGYPASAVEEVGRVKASSRTGKTSAAATKKHAKPLLLAAIVVAGLLLLWASDKAFNGTEVKSGQDAGAEKAQERVISPEELQMVHQQFTAFISANLKEEYWPGSFEPVPRLTSRGTRDARDGVYGLMWEKAGFEFFVQTFFRNIDSPTEVVKVRVKAKAVADSEQLDAILAEIFKMNAAAEAFSCESQKVFESGDEKLTASLFCNQIDVAKGVGKRVITAVALSGETLLYACEIPEGNVRYNATTCYRL